MSRSANVEEEDGNASIVPSASLMVQFVMDLVIVTMIAQRRRMNTARTCGCVQQAISDEQVWMSKVHRLVVITHTRGVLETKFTIWQHLLLIVFVWLGCSEWKAGFVKF